jgi:hypothetical protein
MAKKRFSSRPRSDEITMRGYRVLTFAKCTTIMILSLQYQAVWDPPQIRGNSYSLGWFRYGYGYGYGMVLDQDDFGLVVRSCVIYCNPLVDHTLW